jgi:hypothetical protein
MSRLVVFGCSSTYGQGLPDCTTGREKPSKYAWPSLLSRQLELELINKSQCGAPNKKILLEILNFPFNETDQVAILWSFHHRGYLFHKHLDSKPIMITDDGSKDFYMIHTEYDMCANTHLDMHHAYSFLEMKKLKNHHFYFDKSLRSHIEKKEHIVTMPATYVPYVYEIQADKGTDKIHPGVLSHVKISNFILEKIHETSNVNSGL